MSQEAVKRLGVGNLAQLHDWAKRGYASGGPVGMSAPPMSLMAKNGKASDQSRVALTVNVAGARGNAEIERMIASGVKVGMDRVMTTVKRNIVGYTQEGQMRFGGAI